MTLLYLDDSFANHKTGSHPECPARILRLNELLRSVGWADQTTTPQWSAATPEMLARVHTPAHIAQIQRWDQEEAGQVEADTLVFAGSYLAAARGAGAACDAVSRVLRGESLRAFCAIRPPGHHALVDAPMGFCLFNNVAVAARLALAEGVERILIVDWDVHHGNGTQDMFWDNAQVGFYSSHRFPFYPGTGKRDETGTGAGLGYTRNLPVPGNISAAEFIASFKADLASFADLIRPQFILLSAGFDAHPADPVGGLCLEEEHFAELTHFISDLAITHCQGKIVSLLEGGYHLNYMPLSAKAHLEALHNSSPNLA